MRSLQCPLHLYKSKTCFILFLNNFFNFSIDLAILANSLIKNIFLTPTTFIFLQEYEALAKEYKNEKNYNYNENNIDFFIEYIKPFWTKKPKVKEGFKSFLKRHNDEYTVAESDFLY